MITIRLATKEPDMNFKHIFRKATGKVFQVGLILLISLLVGEATLRVYNYFTPISVFYSSSYNRFRGKPYAYDWDFRLNSQGFKDEEFGDKQDYVYRILGIGDSFAYGVVPYRHNYLTLIESKLQHENKNVEVLNMGIPSIGPKDYWFLLLREGLALKPDMVLLSFFIGNDFIDSNRIRKFYSYSYVASLLYYILNIQRRFDGHGKNDYCDDCPTFDNGTYLQIEKRRSFIYKKGNRRFDRLLDDALHYLSKIKDICRKRDIEFVVVLIPDELQINHALETEIRETFYPNLERDRWDITLPNTALLELLNDSGIHHIDLHPYFAEKSQQQLYRLRDTHWNIAVNQLATDIIQNHIREYIIP